MCLSTQIDKFKHGQSVIRAFYTDDSEKKYHRLCGKSKKFEQKCLINMGKFRKL